MREGPLDLLARTGLASRGAVYVLLGLITIGSGLTGIEKQEKSTSGALSWLREQPFGEIALFAIAGGLALFSAWRLSQSVFNADERDGDLHDWLARIGQFGSAIAYLGLAGFAFQLAVGWASSSDGGSGTESIVAQVMRQPFGPWLVGGGAGIFFGVGVSQFWRGISLAYLKRITLPDLPVPAFKAVSSWGICTRAVLFMIAGGFMAYAAITVDPGQAGSLSEALDWLRRLPFGFYLYLAAAIGLLSFGLFGFVQAVYRHVDVAGYGGSARDDDPDLLRNLDMR